MKLIIIIVIIIMNSGNIIIKIKIVIIVNSKWVLHNTKNNYKKFKKIYFKKLKNQEVIVTEIRSFNNNNKNNKSSINKILLYNRNLVEKIKILCLIMIYLLI